MSNPMLLIHIRSYSYTQIINGYGSSGILTLLYCQCDERRFRDKATDLNTSVEVDKPALPLSAGNNTSKV